MASTQEYRHWFPRLQAFAARCRRANPILSSDLFTAIEREQHRILQTKMREFAMAQDWRSLQAKLPTRAVILSTTKIGLSAAEEAFGLSGAVILEEAELNQWYTDVCPVDHEGIWWYVRAWWTIREVSDSDEQTRIRQLHQIDERCNHWVVISGMLWGPLAGSANAELWQWDGREARLVGFYYMDTY
jgi:hypothetical protein